MIIRCQDRLNDLDSKVGEIEEGEAEFEQYQKQVNKTSKVRSDTTHNRIDEFIENI